MIQWNCYARNFLLGQVDARTPQLAMEICSEIWKKYNIVPSEVSVIPANRDRCRLKRAFDSCTDYRVKY